jgi:hypothetical protein
MTVLNVIRRPVTVIVQGRGLMGFKGDKGDPGNLTGPASSVNENIPIFDGVTGDKLKDSGVKLSDKIDSSDVAVTAAANKIPKADALGKIDLGYLPVVDALNAPYEKVEAHGTISVDTEIAASDGNIHTFTVGGNITLTLNPNCLTGFCRTLTLIITNGGAYVINWPASVKWDGGLAPTFTASGVDIVTLITVDAGTTWYGSANGVRYA